MKSVHFYLAFSIFTLFNIVSYSQTINKPDSTDNKPVQYRRGIELREGYQTYEEKYQGKNLGEEQRRLFPLESTGVWTELNPKVPRVTYVGVYFVNKDTGWVVGDLGALIKTTDGGESWTISETNTTTPLLKVRSYNGQVVITSGYDGLILRSTDGGESFSEMASGLGAGYDLWGLELVNDTLGWACGATGLIKTTDAGESWQIVNTPGFTGNLWWIDFMNKDYGFIAADGNVLRTIDGGENWEIIPAGDYRPLYCVDIIDSLHIAAAGYGGPSYSAKNLYSSNGGYTWIPGGNLTTEEVNCIQYVNPDTGYLVMSGVSARKTTNRGQEWTTLQGISDNYEIQILYNNIGYSAGTEIKICKAEGDLDEWHRLFINDNFSDVFFVNEQKGFVISSASNSNYRGLYKTTNRGDNWESVPEAPDGVDLLFIDSLTGFLGASNSIYKTTDGGDNWYPTQGTNGAGKIFFIDHTTGWAIHSNVIYKTTDKGENWLVQFNAPSSTSFRSIYFVDSLYGWTANSSRPYKTTDGGHNWIQQTNLDIWQSQDVLFSSSMTGYLLESNKLYRTTNGGSTFNLVTGVTGYSVAGKFSNYIDSTFFITGYETFRSLDGGKNWYMFPELDLIRINGLHLLNPGSGYSAGETGLILRYYDTLYTPVELSSFLAKSEGQKVQLTWTTATETNNKGFEVQKKSFGNKWNPIGYVNGIGTTTIPHSYSYTDEIDNPGNYCYRLKQIDFDGSYEYSKEIEVNIASPNRFSLEQNYPNPFNPATTINYQLPQTGYVTLKIYDILGREIATLDNEQKTRGRYSINFDASSLASGVYIYQLRVNDFVSSKKMLLLK